MLHLRLEIELYLYRFCSLFGGGEVALLLKAGDGGNDAVREAAQHGVVALHSFVELAALHGDAVLGAFKLRLQVAEALGGSECRVALDGDLDSVGHGLAQVVLGFLIGFDLLFSELRGVYLGVLHASAGVGHLGQHALFVVGGALYGGYQLRNEVHAAFVDVLYLTPSFLHVLVSGDKLVIHADAPQDDNGYYGNDADNDSGLFHDMYFYFFLMIITPILFL